MIGAFRCLVLITFTVQYIACQLGEPLDACPRYRGLPDGFTRAINKINDRVLYKLDLRDAIRGYQPNKVYRLRVHTTSRKHKFNDATLILDTLDSTCGYGRIVIDNDLLYSPSDCPHFVTTQQKQPMGRAHFKWEAPPCGCVHIRIRVHTNSSYFIEDEFTQNGPLARTICPAARDVITTPSPHTVTPEEPLATRLSRTDRLAKLCKFTKHKQMELLIKEQKFVKSRKLNITSEFEKDRLLIALEQRQIETEECCNEDAMWECFGDVRRRRIDQFCGTGLPDLPFISSRIAWIKQKEPECCWRIGDDRYNCFNHTMGNSQMINDDPNNEFRNFDEEIDEFDPANDIYDFGIIDKEENDKHIHRHADVNDNSADADQTQVKNKTADGKSIRKHRMDHMEENDNLESKEDESMEELLKDDAYHEDDVRGDVDDDLSELDDDDDDDQNDVSNLRPNKDQRNLETHGKILTPEECCFNGITAGTKVIQDGFDGCFKMADMFRKIFTNWNRTCDRKFVVCCFRVVESMTRRPWMSVAKQ